MSERPSATSSATSRRQLQSLGLAAVVGIILVALGVGVWKATNRPATSDADADPVPSSGDADEKSRVVRLTEEKIERSQLHFGVVERRRFRETRAVPGVIAYDGGKHLEVTAPVAGLVKKVLAEPGRMIREGEPLAVLSSADVGLARDEVARRIADLELAREERAWAAEIADNVDRLVVAFAPHPKLDAIERQFALLPLGDYRDKIVSAYSKLLFAEQAMASTADAEEQGALPRRVIEERRTNREVAAATFQSACETARFDARQARRRTLADEAQARRLLSVARERLATLLGPQVDASDVQVDDMAAPETREPASNASAEPAAAEREPMEDRGRRPGDLSEYTLLAPFTGRIEERRTVDAARVQQGEVLFVMADTSKLWVEAEIHERNWKALEQVNEAPIPIRVPALDDAAFETRLRFVGASVSAVNRSVPLVTELDNSAGRFKPGMFVWVDVPLEREREAVVTPAGALMRHEGRAFVFVPLGGGRFERIDVVVGHESGEYVEILSGLEPGREIVTQGAFYLKSELLLERELE